LFQDSGEIDRGKDGEWNIFPKKKRTPKMTRNIVNLQYLLHWRTYKDDELEGLG
jgi:hypothetical protein